MNNTIKEYITKNMRKLTNRYVEEFKEDLEIDLSTLNETTTFPEHLIFIARTCGTFLLFRNKNNANIIINHYKNNYGAHYFVFNTKKDIPYKKVDWKKALEIYKRVPRGEKATCVNI